MKRTALTLAALLVASAAYAGGVNDWTDKDYTCDEDTITSEMTEMMEQNVLGPKMIYVKDIKELSRNKDELKCRVTVVHSRGSQTGTFRFHNRDGHGLVAWKSGK